MQINDTEKKAQYGYSIVVENVIALCVENCIAYICV